MARLYLSIRRRSEKPILPLFLLCADRSGLPLGVVGNLEHGWGGSGVALGRKLSSAACVGHAGRRSPVAGFGRSASQRYGIRTEAFVHAVDLPARNGIAAGLSGGATEALADGEGCCNQHAVEGSRGIRADWNAAADWPRNRNHVWRVASAGGVAGSS